MEQKKGCLNGFFGKGEGASKLEQKDTYDDVKLPKTSNQGFLKKDNSDFPGGAMDKNLPANAGDTGLLAGLGRFHRPQSNEAHMPQVLSPRSRACKPQLLSPMSCNY